MDKYERTVLSRKTWVKKEVKDHTPRKKYVKRTIPRLKYKNELLSDYIKNTDIIYRSDIDKMGYNQIQSALNKYVKFNKIKIIPINYSSWKIIRI